MATVAEKPCEIRPLSAEFGAEISGVDLSRELSPEVIKAIHDAWIEYGLLLFRRSEPFDDEMHMRISRIFGEMEPAATSYLNDPGNPYMMSISYDPADKNPAYVQHYNVGGVDRAGWLGWHWDQSFMPTIVRGAVLRLTEPARTMGETGFADGIAAYNRLDDAMKARIDDLEVVYEFNADFCSGQFGFPKDIRKLPRAHPEKPDQATSFDFPPVVHPLVITQHETGRKVLKLSPMHARYVLGMDKAGSDALLEELACHMGDPAHTYFHKWGPNEMVVWDNWRMIHCANGVPIDVKRMGRRTTIMGDYEVGRYLDPELDRDRKVKRIVD